MVSNLGDGGGKHWLAVDFFLHHFEIHIAKDLQLAIKGQSFGGSAGCFLCLHLLLKRMALGVNA